MTVRVADSLAQLYSNTISGTITDADDNPPGEKAVNISVTLNYSSGHLPRTKTTYDSGGPDPGGYYQFKLAYGDTVPIGTHQLVVAREGEKLTRWVTVGPRSRTVVDFRFGRSFRGQLRMVDVPRLALDQAGFLIHVVNDGADTIPVSWILLKTAPDSAWMSELWIEGNLHNQYLLPRLSEGDTAKVAPTFSVPPNMSQDIEFGFQKFYTDSLGDTLSHIAGDTFVLRFSDGSEITAIPVP
jgi:hypothetical protein